MRVKTCCFIDSGIVYINRRKETQIYDVLESIVVNDGVGTFIFGGRTTFADMCLDIVTALKNKYPHITRVRYICGNEAAVLQSKYDRYKGIYMPFEGMSVYQAIVDKEYRVTPKSVGGPDVYAERDMAMVDNSDICVFYYSDERHMVSQYNRHEIAFCIEDVNCKNIYNHARQKHKKIINLYKKNDLV